MWPYARRRRRPWPLLLALLQSTALLTPRPVLRGPRPLRSTPADLQPRTGGAGNRPLRSTPANVEPRTESGGNKKPPPKFTPKAFGSDKKYANPREAHRAAAKMRKDAEAAFLDRPRDALELYRRATALAPSHSALAWLRLARLHRQFKDPSSARAALRRGTRHLPKDARLWRALAQACKAAGDIEGARNHYGVVTRLDPDFVAGWDAWSRLELREGNAAKAAQLAKKGLSKVGALDAETPPHKVKGCGTPTRWRWRRAAAGLASILTKLRKPS